MTCFPRYLSVCSYWPPAQREITHSKLGPPTLIINGEDAPQASPQANLVWNCPYLRFPLPMTLACGTKLTGTRPTHTERMLDEPYDKEELEVLLQTSRKKGAQGGNKNILRAKMWLLQERLTRSETCPRLYKGGSNSLSQREPYGPR